MIKTKAFCWAAVICIIVFLDTAPAQDYNSITSKGKSAISPNKQTSPTIVLPSTGEAAYEIAGENFAKLWEKVTGYRPKTLRWKAGEKLPQGDVVLIGSDAVNPVVHDLIQRGVIDSLDIQYGSDQYRILCVKDSPYRYLVVAGGSGRSTIYAAYDFFRRQAGVEYFWDGDVVPHCSAIDFGDIDVTEKPRFQYRGLRYFAHRGLHRFQAEHWDLEDWKREIDWLTKKRFNLFMLRIGNDDLFQRAFPDDVPYPPITGKDPDALEAFNDRTSFWPLKYRGQLRKQILQYARDRGLIHPEDAGTITHWYSYTPAAFFRSFPDFPVSNSQTGGYYNQKRTAIWDIETQRAWDTYWKLTETHIREYGSPSMFHTIGLAERKFGETRRENLQRKLYVYRKTQQNIREHYPDSPLLIASWDLGYTWQDEEVQQLLKELDPARTILLDYLADDSNKAFFNDWNVPGRFPWIFGIFQGFVRNTEIREDYKMLAKRLEIAKNDSLCKGLVLWSEVSHSDTFMLECLAKNSWCPNALDTETLKKSFCKTRYPKELAAGMEPLWASMLATSQSSSWSLSGPENELTRAIQYQILSRTIWEYFSPKKQAFMKPAYDRLVSGLAPAPEMLAGLASLAETSYGNPYWRRDALDMARTVANNASQATVILGTRKAEAWRKKQADPEEVRQLAKLNLELLQALADILAQSDDFSMAASLARLQKAQPINQLQPTVNPHSEKTLKGNAENGYCRSQQYELVRHVYYKEATAFWNHVLNRMESGDRSEWNPTKELDERSKEIKQGFYATPLAELAPQSSREPLEMAQVLRRLENLVHQFLMLSGKGEL